MAAQQARETWRNQIVRYADEAPDQLLGNPRNFRLHPKPQQDAMSGALAEVGWIAPVIVNEVTQHVIDGHLRIELAISRGEPTVPVAYVNLTPEAEALALATFDPIGALAATDAEKLDELLREVSTGDAAVQAMLAGLAESAGIPGDKGQVAEDPGAQIDRAEELRAKWGTERGQLWEIDRHRLLCGDSTSAEDVARLMGGVQPHALLSDPPYGMALDTEYSVMHRGDPSRGIRGGNDYAPVTGDDHLFNAAPLIETFSGVAEQVWWGADYYRQTLPDGGSWFVWDKRWHEGGSDLTKQLGSHFELCWSRQPHLREVARITWVGMIGLDSERRRHPTQKPVALAEWCLERVSKTGQRVLDPFAGSGWTLLACEQSDRIGFGCEIEPKYVAVALERLAGMGLSPRLSDG